MVPLTAFKTLISEIKLSFSIRHLVGNLESPPSTWHVGTKGDIILVPGFGGSWRYSYKIGEMLNKQGYKIHTVPELEKDYNPLLDSSERLKKAITSLKTKNCILVCHSKGGLVAIEALKDSAISQQVKTVINIATPNNGSIWGHFQVLGLKDLRPGKTPKSQDTTKIVNIYPSLDYHVIPNTSLILENGKNHKIKTLGHINALFSEETENLILEALN